MTKPLAAERIDKHAAASILGCTPKAVVIMAARGELASAGAAKITREWTFDEARLREFALTFKRPKRPNPLYPVGDIYVVGFQSYIKIGFTGDRKKRLGQLQSGIPVKLVIYKIIENIAREFEERLHERFAAYRLEGEWFRKEGDVAAWIKAGCPL